MKIKDLIQSHEEENKILQIIQMTPSNDKKNGSYEVNYKHEHAKVEDMSMGIASVVKSIHQTIGDDYEDVAINAIIKIIELDPNYNKDSVKSMINMLEDWKNKSIKHLSK